MTDSNDAPQTAIRGKITWIGQLDEKGNPIGPNLAQPGRTSPECATCRHLPSQHLVTSRGPNHCREEHCPCGEYQPIMSLEDQAKIITSHGPSITLAPGSAPEPIVNTPLSVRLRRSLMHSGTRALSLYRFHRQAHEAMVADARTLATLGFEPHMEVSAAHLRITLGNGSQIRYIGGDDHRLEHQLRGMRCDHLDGGGLVSPEVVFWLTGKRED